jgi:glycosyltransferase involved in cell wall biosynthesis
MSQAVLHVYEDYKWTGASQPIAVLCRELNRRGWRAELVCCGAAPDPEKRYLHQRAREMGLTVHDDFIFESDPNIEYNARDIDRLSRLIEDGEFSIVHVHGSWDHILAAIALRRSPSKAPLVRTDHGAREFSGRLLEHFQFGPGMTDHLIVLSDRFRARAVDRLGRDPATVSTVRGAVALDDFPPIEPPVGIRDQFGLASDDIVVGLVARVQRHRRFEVLLEAAQLVQSRQRGVKIVVLGRGTHKEEILDRPVKDMGLQDTVYPLGYRHEDYEEVLAMCDAGLMLVPGSDGSCRAAMQMCSMAKPMVVAQRGVLPDIVADGETGLVVKDTPENLAEAILEMAASEQKRRQWGRAARQRMRDKFSVDRQARRLIGVYERLLRA